MIGDGLVERTVIRMLCFLLGGWAILSAVQLLVVYNFTAYSLWFDSKTLSLDSCFMNVMLILQLIIGLVLISAKIWHKYRLILWSLGFMWVYHLSLALISGILFKLQFSGFMPYLMIGLTSALLWAYYKSRTDNTEQDKELLV